jgi:hypothetical protein
MVKVTWSNKKSSSLKGDVTIVGVFDGAGSDDAVKKHLGANYKDSFKRLKYTPSIGSILA